MNNFEKLAKMPKEERRGMVLDLWESNRNINGFFNILMSEAEPTATEEFEEHGYKKTQESDVDACFEWGQGYAFKRIGIAQAVIEFKAIGCKFTDTELAILNHLANKYRKERGWE